MGDDRCPLCAGHPRLVRDEGRAVCHTCGYLAERTEYEAVFDAQYGTGTRQLAPSGVGGALASSQFRMRSWARTQYASRPPDADTATHIRHILGRLAARIPAVGAATTPALHTQVQRVVQDVRARARQAKAAYRAFQTDASLPGQEDDLVSHMSAVASAASAIGTDLPPQSTHALVNARLSWGTQGHGNALVAAAVFALLYEGGHWVPLDPLAVVAETTAYNIQVKYLLLTHLYPTFPRTAPIDPRTEIPGLMTRLRAVQSALQSPQSKRQRVGPSSGLASATAAVAQSDLDAVEALAMGIAQLAGTDLALTPGLEIGALRRDPLTAALSCLSLALESCHGATIKRGPLADLMNIIVTAPSAEALPSLLLSGPSERPVTSTLLRKYELLLHFLRNAARGLPWLTPSRARYTAKPPPKVRGRDSFWDKGRAASEGKGLSRSDLVRHAQAIISIRLAEKQGQLAERTPPAPTPAVDRPDEVPSPPHKPSVASLSGIQSWAALDELPPDELDQILFRPGEVEMYLRPLDEQEAYRQAMGQAVEESEEEEELVGPVEDFPFPLWSTEVGGPEEDY